jgi:hypothetical protein
MRASALDNPLTDAEVEEANRDLADLWIHVKCHQCGDVECCFNRTEVARTRTCFPCLMGWTNKSQAVINEEDK